VGLAGAVAALGFGAVVSVTAGSAGASSGKPVKIAYLSYAVANSYDAPMLANAKAVAKSEGASLTVFDANNSPSTQLNQLQTVVSSKQYNAIITQPINSLNLITTVKSAIKSGIRVVNMDQPMGPALNTVREQVPGLSGNIMKVITVEGAGMAKLTVQACAAHHLNPCNVGYVGAFAGSSYDQARSAGISTILAGRSNIKIVDTVYGGFTVPTNLAAVQPMLQAHPEINLLLGSDQSVEGALQGGADPSKITMVGDGGSSTAINDIKKGTWFGTVFQDPGTEGKVAAQCVIAAVRTGKNCGGQNPLLKFPNGGLITKANVDKFKAQWVG
jgi:ribose transport system substrate-binding protein